MTSSPVDVHLFGLFPPHLSSQRRQMTLLLSLWLLLIFISSYSLRTTAIKLYQYRENLNRSCLAKSAYFIKNLWICVRMVQLNPGCRDCNARICIFSPIQHQLLAHFRFSWGEFGRICLECLSYHLYKPELCVDPDWENVEINRRWMEGQLRCL